MKFLQVIVGIFVLGIFGFSLLMIYSQYQYYQIVSENAHFEVSLTNEFYLVSISTVVLALFSIPALIYQIKSILTNKVTSQHIDEDDLIDNDNIVINNEAGQGKFLHGSTKLYAFALLTQVILLGKRSSHILSRLSRMEDWVLLAGFVISMFVAIYFLSVDRKNS